MRSVRWVPALVAAGLFCIVMPGSSAEPAAAQPKPAPKPKPARQGIKWDSMDVGPFFSSGLSGQNPVLKSIAIKLGNGGYASFDTEMLRLAMGWKGELVELPTGRAGLEGVPKIGGGLVFNAPKGPGWGQDGAFKDGRPLFQNRPYGPLPREHAKWKGLYLHGDKTLLSYTVGSSSVLELPGYETVSGKSCFTRSFRVEGAGPLDLAVVAADKRQVEIKGAQVFLTDPAADGTNSLLLTVDGTKGATWRTDADGRVILSVKGSSRGINFRVAIWHGRAGDLASGPAALGKVPDLRSLTRGGPSHWGAPLVVKGNVGREEGAYVVDTITVPEDNPWKSWIRCSGVDFFSDGRAAICSVSGDVWIVGGLDAGLEKVTWKRYATGLFQPLGLKIVKDKVYVLGRDQITRLHDLNKDDEADYYENFNNDVSITAEYHEFVLNLDTDSKGNFYFVKGGNLGEARLPHHGCLLRVPPDGSRLDIVATGFRAPNGMGIGPNDEITVSDNEGNWVPSSRVSFIKPGGFYGHVFTAHRDPKPTDYDRPICWLPKSQDNSSGGQVWVTSDKWGPLKGQLLHMSYGTCGLFNVMHEEVDGQVQGGMYRFPLKFVSGIMRAHFHPTDGQLYLCGLSVWQSNAAKEGGFHRVRYTGKAANMPLAMHVRAKGVEIQFTDPLDSASAADAQNYSVEQYNYRWTENYGSKDYSVATPEKSGRDRVEVRSAKLSQDRRTLFLELPEVIPVMQMRIKYNIKAADGSPLNSEINNSIYRVPKS